MWFHGERSVGFKSWDTTLSIRLPIANLEKFKLANDANSLLIPYFCSLI